MLLLLGLLCYVASAQKDCYFNLTLNDGTVFDLDLSNHTGEFHHVNGNTGSFYMSLCNNSIECVNQGSTVYAMIAAYNQGALECYHIATWDNAETYPVYSFGDASWRFNYTNGGRCTATENYRALVFFDCHPGTKYPYLVKAWHYDRCGFVFQYRYGGACEPPFPPNLECKFKAYPTEMTLDLSTLKGVDMVGTDEYGLSWHYTPCNNGLECYFPSGNHLSTMAQIQDHAGNCAKFLGLWSGDVQPHYFKGHQDEDVWRFHWFNGMECSLEDPPEEFSVYYVCDPDTATYFVNATHHHRCHFSMEILTRFACTSGQ